MQIGNTDEEVKKAIQDAQGNVTAAAQMLGIRRDTLAKRISKSEVLKRFKADVLEVMKDDAESTFYSEALRKKDLRALQAWLDRFARDRGWGTKQEISTDGSFAQVVAPARAESEEEWMDQNEAAA